jgi:hypothetical protein
MTEPEAPSGLRVAPGWTLSGLRPDHIASVSLTATLHLRAGTFALPGAGGEARVTVPASTDAHLDLRFDGSGGTAALRFTEAGGTAERPLRLRNAIALLGSRWGLSSGFWETVGDWLPDVLLAGASIGPGGRVRLAGRITATLLPSIALDDVVRAPPAEMRFGALWARLRRPPAAPRLGARHLLPLIESGQVALGVVAEAPPLALSGPGWALVAPPGPTTLRADGRLAVDEHGGVRLVAPTELSLDTPIGRVWLDAETGPARLDWRPTEEVRWEAPLRFELDVGGVPPGGAFRLAGRLGAKPSPA